MKLWIRMMMLHFSEAARVPAGRSSAEPAGDFRGSYGFGRRAHRPDPAAEYRFSIDDRRVRVPRTR
jgi:hypothetical protein